MHLSQIVNKVLGRGDKASIVCRQTPDWATLDYSYLETVAPFEKMAMLPEGFISRMVLTWDKIFPTTYFEIRQNLKELSLQNLKTVKQARIVDLERFRNENNPAPINLFIDDDDFFNPEIVRLLGKELETNDAVLWCSALYKGDLELRRDFHCYTNNYAVSRDYLLEDFTTRLVSVEQHFWMNRVAKNSGAAVSYLDRPLSVANKHPCSPSWLWNCYGPEFSEDDMRAYVNDFVTLAEQLKLDDELSWVSGSLDDVRNCFARLV